MDTIGQLWQEGNQIKKNIPLSGNYNELQDKGKILSWSKRYLSFLIGKNYIIDSLVELK